jgi:hypothetical protein
VHNPYGNTGPNLENNATRIISIVPADADLPQVCKGLRIWNPNTTESAFVIVTIKGDQVNLMIPAKSLFIEPTVVARVMETGTDPNLIFHGYTD